MDAKTALTLVLAMGFAAVHLFGERLAFLSAVPRSAWLSAAGASPWPMSSSTSSPGLAEGQRRFAGEAKAAGGAPAAVDRHVHLLALAGLAAFYGLERLARGGGAFWVHVGSYALCNGLIGCLLLRRGEGLAARAIAMALRFLVNDGSLAARHGGLHRRAARWLLAAAVLVGWAVGAATEPHPLAIPALTAFLAGGVVLNVLKEEPAEERRSRFLAFALGVGLHAAVLLLAGEAWGPTLAVGLAPRHTRVNFP